MIELQYWRNADIYPVWLTKHLRISPEKNEKSLIRIEMETFDKVCGDNRGLFAVTQKQNGMFLRCDDSQDSFHGSVAFTKSINQITCWTLNMLSTRLSPDTVNNQYIGSHAAAFPTICCVPDIPFPLYFVIGQRDKRQHSGDTADGMIPRP